jgi:hypothetical protein
VSDAKRLRSLEDENRRLNKLLAEATLDNAMRTWGERAAGVRDDRGGADLDLLSASSW